MWRPRWTLLLSIILGAAPPSRAQTPASPPELTFRDPAGFYRSAAYPPADYSAQEVNAALQVYPFRVVAGDVRQAFSRTLLRELIDPRYQETNVAPGARLDAIAIPGADLVLRARFREMVAGMPRERMRLVVVSGTSAAIVDASASSMAAWQRVLPALNAFSTTLSVVRGGAAVGAPPSDLAPPGPAGRVVAGLYMGFKNKYVADLVRGPGYGRWENALHYYLFSADGRVYRAYDALTVPGNDPARFDFAGAERADPENSGRYTIRGDSLFARIGAASPETIAARVPSANVLVIGRVRYERQ
jgi:hypothetical protein